MRYRHEVYYNLHKQCLSIRNISTGLMSADWADPSWKHVMHMEAVNMQDVTFAVQPAGRLKVVNTGRKNVHAFVRGTVLSYVSLDDPWTYNTYHQRLTTDVMSNPKMIEVTYNPYKYDSFVDRNTLTPVFAADRVYVVGKNIYAIGTK